MESARFHNALRSLRCIGENDLREFGVIDENWGTPEASDRDQLGDFFRDPYAEAIRMPDANYQRLFALIESRQKPKDLSAFDLLCRCFDAFDGEEDSVREEHAELIEEVEAFIELHRPSKKTEWSGSPCPKDPDNFWIDDATGERVNAVTGERGECSS
ncbi:MAG: hypothetical protein WA975_18150 [Mesorhizobium sp.]